jgi:murein DD-endopeptidase MepM/ murein hydrolase activator NlpD
VCPIGAPNAFTDSWGAPRSGGRRHQGADVFAAYGTPLYALEAGAIRTSDNSLGGVSVHLAGTSGDAYYYAHLSKRDVVTGQRVAVGEVVGAVGNSGNARSTPPHLHVQYHPGGGVPVNPTALLTALCR